MKKLLVFAALCAITITSYSATIISADSALITGSAYNNHYGQYGLYFPADGKRLDMTTPTIANGAAGYATISVYSSVSRSATAGSNFGCTPASGNGWRIRVNGAAANGIKFEKIDAFKITPEDGTATLDADNDTLTMGGRIQNAGGATMMAVDADSQWRFAIQAGGSWYISDPVNSRAIGYPATGAANISHSIEATESIWYAYDPTTAPTENGVVDVGAVATPDFTSVTAAGVHQFLLSNGTAGNHGFKTFTLTGTINGDGPGPWAPTNSINWANSDYDGDAVTQGGNKGFDFSTATHYADESMGTGGPTIYGAAYSPEAAYIYSDSAQTNSTGTFDYRFSKNNNGGLGMRVGRPAGGVVSGTNINSGVISAYTLHMFPVTGLAENDADITLQTWSNQGAGGVNMTDGEIRFVVAKNYAGTTNWAISSPVTHSVGTGQYKTVTSATTFQGLDWFNYSPANAWSIDDVGSQVLAPYPGDALAVGFRLNAAGVSETNNTAFVFGARSFTYTEREWNEYDNDNLVVDMDAVADTPNEGAGGVQWEFRDITYNETTPLIVSNSVLGDNEVTNFWNGASVYVGFKMDGVYPAWDENIDYDVNTELNFNSAAFSASRNTGAGGLKIQWNGAQLTPGSATGTSPELEYANGRFVAGDKATALLIWKSDEFLGGAAGSTYEMTAANDVLRANVILGQGNGTGDEQLLESGKIRFVVKEGDSYYISHASMITNMTTEEVIKQGTSTSWFTYDPSSLDTVDTSGEAVDPALTEIEAFGVWMQATVATNTGYRKYPRFGLADFSAGAIVNTPNAASIKQAWIDLYSGVMGAATADDDDYDGDGVVNILEYAFGGDPTDSNSEGNQPTHGTTVNDSDEEMFEYIYFERSDATARGLSSAIKESDNLIFTDFAAPSSSYEVGRGASVHSGFDAVTNHVPMTDSAKFIKVEVNYSE